LLKTSLLALWFAVALGAVSAQEFVREPATASAPQDFTREKATFAPFSFKAKDGTLIPYRLLAPEHVMKGRRYPLIVVLHGSGSVGTDNLAQMSGLAAGWAAPRVRQRFPAYVLAPQAPARTANYAPSKADGLLAAVAGAPMPAIVELIEQTISSQSVDAARVYITGFSMGASAGWQAMLLRPKMFAAAVLCSGVPPERELAEKFAGQAILMVHGNIDPENPFAPDRAMFAAMQRVPTAKVRFREYDNLMHAVPGDVVATDLRGDWWRTWLFAQKQVATP
jgi:predicted peptidase